MEDMKTFKDLKFKQNIGGWSEVKNYFAEETFENGYSVRVEKRVYKRLLEPSYSLYIMKNGKIQQSYISCLTEERISEIMLDTCKIDMSKYMTLSTWEKIQIERADKNKPVKFNYRVIDCEHEGDMDDARAECNEFCVQHGGKVISEYWDGEDCGEAFVTCEFPFNKVEEVFLAGFFEHDFYQY